MRRFFQKIVLRSTICIIVFLTMLTYTIKARHIPHPKDQTKFILQQWQDAEGSFTLTEKTRIVLPKNNTSVVKLLQAPNGWLPKLRALTGLKLPIAIDNAGPGDIVFNTKMKSSLIIFATTATLKNKQDATNKSVRNASRSITQNILNEGFTLDIDSHNINITSKTDIGALRALQTLVQMLIGCNPNIAVPRILPAGSGFDYPVYENRALMLDLGRLFVPANSLIEMMDMMGLFKINILRAHLSDTYRIKDENIGAFRLYSHKFPTLKPKDSCFYTYEDWNRLEDAAYRNGIQIIPELDSPGHANSITTAFPEWPHYDPSTLDIRTKKNREIVSTKMANLIGEFLPWFKSRKIHLGGDEPHKINGEPFNWQLYDYANLLREKLLTKKDASGKTYLDVKGFSMWAYDPRDGDKKISARSDSVLNKNIMLETWWDGQPSMMKNTSTINYISSKRDWVEGREQLIIPYNNVFKNKTGSSEIYYKHLYTNLGYEKTLPKGLMLQVWNDVTKTNYKKWADVESEVLCVLPGMGVMNWTGYENGPKDLSKLKPSLEAMSKWIINLNFENFDRY